MDAALASMPARSHHLHKRAASIWPARQYPASIKEDYLPPSILPQVAEQLRSLGYKESSVRAIMSGNFMRVASQVWAT